MPGAHVLTSGAEPGAATRTILVVEDEHLVLELISSEIEEAGFVVLQAMTAEEGLGILVRSPIDLLFTDIRLPGAMDGWQLAEEARRLNPLLPVIYATGFTMEAPRLVSGGVFIRKPYVPSFVVGAIETLMGAAAA